MPRCDFDGWATKNDILCSDGRVIKRNAFKDNDGTKVPLVYQHFHDSPANVLGHAILENRDEGVYAYCSFNDTPSAKNAKELVKHGDLDSLSIYANKLQQNGKEVLHGTIREVSLVLAGANSGAKILNTYIEHSDGSTTVDEDEAIIQMNSRVIFRENDSLKHADKEENDMANEKENKAPIEDDETIEDIIDTMNEKQKNVMYYLVGEALSQNKDKSNNKEEDSEMKHNAFENDIRTGNYIEHGDELRSDILSLMSSNNRSRNNITSLRDTVLEHAASYGIDNVDYLFPDARTIANTPEFIKRDDDWVDDFMNGSKHTPFSRVKTVFADITADEARAKGYTKGNKKLEEVITLLKRTIEPTTIYKKQKLDRDDILDITDFDVVVWLKTEMRMMLNEEIARAALIGDGRSSASNDKIKETSIIPIWTDDSLFTISAKVEITSSTTEEQKSDAIIKKVLKSRKNYKGSGNPTFYTTEDTLTEMLLIEDGIGRRKYDTVEDVAKALRVKKIVTVPVMENKTRTVVTDDGNETRTLVGIIVNPIDYNFGSDKGGAVSMFDDFDIDYNQQKYLMETRCSGGLVKPYSAIAVETVTVSGS